MAANPTFANKTYAGEFFDELFGPVVLDPAGLEDAGLATAIDRSKFKETIYEGDDTVELQDASPTYTSQTSAGQVVEVNLLLTPYDFNKTISLDEIRQSWYSSKLGAGSMEDYTYDVLVDMYINNIYVPKLKQAQDNLVINGKTGLDATVGSYSFSATYNGLYALFNASSEVKKVSIAADNLNIVSVTKGTTTVLTVASDARDSLTADTIISVRGAAGTGWTAINGDWSVLDVTATTVTIGVDTDALTSGDYTTTTGSIQFINALNIIKKLVSHVRALPTQVRRNGVVIAIPSHLEMEWNFANSEVQQNGGAYYQRSTGLNLNDVKIVVLDNAPANTLGSWAANRVFYGYDLAGDYSNVQVLWQGDTTGNKVYHVLGKMKTGVAITTKFQNEITLSTPDA
jgi:hypothetical protein